MRNTLIDAGPIIALFDRGDRYHYRIVDLIKRESLHLISTWPVITEASHMLDFNNKAQISLLEWIYRGGLELAQIDAMGHQRTVHSSTLEPFQLQLRGKMAGGKLWRGIIG